MTTQSLAAFEERSTRFDDGSENLRWVSGRYEVVAYEHDDEITGSSGLLYYAFVAIEPLKDDGIPGHVNNKRVGDRPYHRLDDAVAACEQHATATAA